MNLRSFHPHFRWLADFWSGTPRAADGPASGWDGLLAWMKHGKLSGFVHQRALDAGIALSPAVMQVLREERWHVMAANERIATDADALCREAAARGAKAVPLKGLWLNRNLYGDSSLRATSDIDLMASPSDVEVFHELLTVWGYTRMPPEHRVPYQAVFKRPGRTPVEVHTLLTTPDENPPPSAEILARAAGWGEPGEGLDPADNLIYLCINNAKDNLILFPGNLVDVDAMVRKHGGDTFWEAVVERTRRWRWSTGVWANLAFASELFATPVPDTVRRALQAPAWRRSALALGLRPYRSGALVPDNLPRGWGSLYKSAIVEDVMPLAYVRRRRALQVA